MDCQNPREFLVLRSTRYKGRDVRAELKPKGLRVCIQGSLFPSSHVSTQLKMKLDSLQRRDAAIHTLGGVLHLVIPRQIPTHICTELSTGFCCLILSYDCTSEVQHTGEKAKMQKKTTASGQKKKKSAGERRNLENRSEKKHSESLREIQKDNEYAKYELDACKRKQLQNKKEFLEIIC